jgi:hypothetical protein
MTDQVRRSWLIVPAHDLDRLAEAAQSGADPAPRRPAALHGARHVAAVRGTSYHLSTLSRQFFYPICTTGSQRIRLAS